MEWVSLHACGMKWAPKWQPRVSDAAGVVDKGRFSRKDQNFVSQIPVSVLFSLSEGPIHALSLIMPFSKVRIWFEAYPSEGNCWLLLRGSSKRLRTQRILIYLVGLLYLLSSFVLRIFRCSLSSKWFQLGLYMSWGDLIPVKNNLNISVTSHNRHFFPIYGTVECRHLEAVFHGPGSFYLDLFPLPGSLHSSSGWLKKPWRIHASFLTITTQKWNVLVPPLPCFGEN